MSRRRRHISEREADAAMLAMLLLASVGVYHIVSSAVRLLVGLLG